MGYIRKGWRKHKEYEAEVQAHTALATRVATKYNTIRIGKDAVLPSTPENALTIVDDLRQAHFMLFEPHAGAPYQYIELAKQLLSFPARLALETKDEQVQLAMLTAMDTIFGDLTSDSNRQIAKRRCNRLRLAIVQRAKRKRVKLSPELQDAFGKSAFAIDFKRPRINQKLQQRLELA